ncbi:hypothetical protein PFISCL1PPCAC_19222, partial [Pristionchus fissidentatus]
GITGVMSHSDVNSPLGNRSTNGRIYDTSLMDLPDEILSKIISHLDLPSRLKFRVNRRINRIELETKNQILEFTVAESEYSWSVVVEELNQLESIDVEMKIEDLKEGLKRIAKNTECTATNIYPLEEANRETIEMIKLVICIPSRHIDISPRNMKDKEDDSESTRLSIFDILDYNLILSICKKRNSIRIEFECDSLSVQEWIQIRQKMLSREISTTYLNVFIDETIASSILFAIHGVKFEWTRDSDSLIFYCKEEGKKILYNTPSDDIMLFSIHIFDGLFLTTFYAFEDVDDLLRFGMKMKWCKDEKEVTKIRTNCKEKAVRAQPNFELPSAKRMVEEIYISEGPSDYYHLTIEEIGGFQSVESTFYNLNELKRRLKRLAKFTICIKISIDTISEVDRETFELLNLLLEIEADEGEIKPDDEQQFEMVEDKERSLPSFNCRETSRG